MSSVMEIAMKEMGQLIELAQSNLKVLPGPIVNVAGYGTTGDGTTNETVIVQTAIDYAISKGMKAVFFPRGINGQYYVTALTNANQVVLFGDNASFVGGYAGEILQIGEGGVTPAEFNALETSFNAFAAGKAKQMVYMSDYASGNGTTETTAIQQAIDASVGKILIWTKQSGAYYETRALTLPSDIHIIFAPGTLVKAATGFIDSERMFNARGVSNITIEGNYATLQMLKSEYTTGEQRHVFYLMGNENVTIKNLIVKDSGGDGFLISGEQFLAPLTTSKNINILGNIIDNNKRQGISVVGLVDGVIIDGNIIKNTIGTAPQSAIDIEPNGATFDNRNIMISNNTLIDNVAGILVYDNSYDVTIRDNKLYNSANIFIRRTAVEDANPTVKIRGNVIKNSSTTGIYVSSCAGIEIYNNEIDVAATVGIYIQSLFASSTFNNIVRDNTIKSTTSTGINLEGCYNSLVEGNFLKDVEKSGITINASSHNVVVRNNKLENCTSNLAGEAALKVITSNNCHFKGNRVRKGTRIPLQGIYVGPTCLETLIDDNDLFDSGTADYLSDSTSTIFKYNRWLDGSISPYRAAFLPATNKGWLGAVAMKINTGANDGVYFCLKDNTGAFIFKQITFI